MPGAAEVTAAAGVGLYPDATLTPDAESGLAPATLGAGTRLRVRAKAGATAAGTAIYDVATLDGATAGFVSATGVAPRDSASPRIWEVDAGAAALSPNGDGRGDTVTLAARASEPVTWHIQIANADGTTIWDAHATGERINTSWDGLVEGAAVPDGSYTVTFSAADGWGNAPASATTQVVVDTVAPVLDQVHVQATSSPVFMPNGDGVRDTIALGFASSEPGTVAVTVRNAGGATVATFEAAMAKGAGSVTWDGRGTSGAFVPDGTYDLALRPADRASNRGPSITTAVVAYGALGYVASSAAAIHARDRDRFAATTVLSFRLLAPATVTWTLEDETGAVVYPKLTDRALAAGSYHWTWDGRLPSGAWAPSGLYRTRVVATDGVTRVAQTASFRVDAFRLSLSDATPARGQLITATLISAEPLRANPRVTVTQPGLKPVVLSTVRTYSNGYRVSFRLSTHGTVGPLVVRINGYDIARGYNWTSRTFAMQ